MTEQGTSAGGRWRRLFAPLAITVVAAMLLLAACGGDDDEEVDGGGNGDATATEAASGGDETTDADDGADDAASNLSALAENYEEFTGVISYEITGFSDGSFTSMKIYKGEGATRTDYGSEGRTGTTITTGDAIYICGEGACIKYPTGDSSFDPTAALTAYLSVNSISEIFGDIPEGVEVEESNEEIAGVDATCYSYTGNVDETESGDESAAICVSESGLLLRLKFSGGGGGGQFEATEASDGVSDADFEPPFPVTDLSNLGQ